MYHHLTVLESSLKMPLLSLPVKSFLVKTASGLVLISPVPDIQQFKEQIDAVGAVTDLVAPNGYHHLGMAQAIALFPNATVWGVPALREKCADIPWQKDLFSDVWPYSDELEIVPLQGAPKLDEVVFFHKPYKRLIVTDLCFNHVDGSGFGYWLMFNIFGAYQRFAVGRLLARLVEDKALFQASLANVLALDFETIMLPHGMNVTTDAKATLKAALQERGFDDALTA